MVELSHMAFPAQKNKVEDGTAFLPSNPSCRAVRLNFFEIAMKNRRRRKTVSHSDSAFHSRNNHTCGFSAKNVRTSSKNCRKKVKSHSVGEIAPSQTTDGGRHGIPPLTPPAAPSDTIFLRLRLKRNKSSEASPHFIQGKLCIRILSEKCSNFK